MSRVAVLTTDIIRSTALPKGDFDRVIEALNRQLETFRDEGRVAHFELYRGDSAQLIVRKPSIALETAFLLKTCINRLESETKSAKRGQGILFDIRIGIGVGTVSSDHLDKMTNEQPFLRSGKGLDILSDDGLRLGVFTGHPEMDKELATELYLYEWIMEQWSLATARIVFKKLQGLTERAIAEELDISQSAVNQHSQAAHWNGLKRLLQRYEELIKNYYG